MKRYVALLASVVLVAVVAMPATAKAIRVARLGPGEVAFWDGPFVKQSGRPSSFVSISGTGGGTCAEDVQCYEYEIAIESGRGQIRVAIDSIDADDRYWVQLFNPVGEQVDSTSPLYSAELYAPAQPGIWKVRVVAESVIDGRFRMRAKFEERDAGGSLQGPPSPLLPNLRLLPPFKFTFESPAALPAGTSPGCTEDETVEHLPQRCLRFSLGPANHGDGPLELWYESFEGVGREGTIYQRILYTDGSKKEREAGTFEYHTTHGHFHHAGFGSLELYRVKDPRSGGLVRAGEGPKQGFCMAPYLIVDWKAFSNDRAYTAEANCSEFTPATGSHMGLDKGWADIYDWYLPGNYVDFGLNGDGHYVVRSMTDAGRDIRETNELDNYGYAYIEVRGDRIEVLERGYGRSPWDPNKLVEPEWLMPTV